jgi:Methylase involved in ubiquinone/menaquinone biosynthesis
MTTETYIRLNRGLFFELWQSLLRARQARAAAQVVHWRTSLAYAQILECYGIPWRNKELLEIGCGQKLAYTLSFSQRNKVTAIDTEPPFHRPYLRSAVDLLRFAGPYRTLKTFANTLLGTRRAFKRQLSAVTDFHGSYDVRLLRMNSLALDFPADCFDGVFSFSVFEHISDPRQALQEVKRVLKPGGVFYLDLHLYTAIAGDHDPRWSGAAAAMKPWKHLRPSCQASRIETCYLNKVRLPEWRRMLEETFDSIHFRTIEGESERCRPHLTDEIRGELADYAEEELLTTTVIAVAKKT